MWHRLTAILAVCITSLALAGAAFAHDCMRVSASLNGLQHSAASGARQQQGDRPPRRQPDRSCRLCGGGPMRRRGPRLGPTSGTAKKGPDGIGAAGPLLHGSSPLPARKPRRARAVERSARFCSCLGTLLLVPGTDAGHRREPAEAVATVRGRRCRVRRRSVCGSTGVSATTGGGATAQRREGELRLARQRQRLDTMAAAGWCFPLYGCFP
jgi:hypothetical protein